MRTTNSYIKVNEDAKMKLARVFDVEPKTVYLALTGRRNSDKARKIRYAAVKEYGGVPMLHCPACETLHETTEDGREVMRQEWPNGAVLVWYKGTPEVIVRHKGREVLHEDCANMPRFTEIQLYAESL
ncbi:hypothetical protein [Bacteroides acidifaciens]|jgi:hypothetical protein|uniref:hypothetical protein n=1 Tax=Bacteroides acidifaciens TaxID=85831 RepID=UPI00242D7411|nr:hypothetical protein [Bacteroides acidifaciens]